MQLIYSGSVRVRIDWRLPTYGKKFMVPITKDTNAKNTMTHIICYSCYLELSNESRSNDHGNWRAKNVPSHSNGSTILGYHVSSQQKKSPTAKIIFKSKKHRNVNRNRNKNNFYRATYIHYGIKFQVELLHHFLGCESYYTWLLLALKIQLSKRWRN